MKIIFTFAVCFLFACSIIAQQKNRYGMNIIENEGGNCKIEEYELINKIIDLSKVDDLYEPYNYVADKIKDSDYNKCTTKSYIFKKYNTYSLNMEIDQPTEGCSPYPFIIYVHGGGWNTGDTNAFANQSKYMASKGIAGIRVTYTLNKNGGHFEQGLQEIAEAFDFIKKHAKEWNLDMKRFGFAGGSAGTPLSSYWAMKMKDCKLYIGCNGIYDFTAHIKPQGSFPNKNVYLRNITTENKAREVSALFLVPKNDPPAVLVAHGTADTTIPYQQSEALCNAIEVNGGKTVRLIYPYYVHGFFNKNRSDKYEEVILKMYEFVKEVFNHTCT